MNLFAEFFIGLAYLGGVMQYLLLFLGICALIKYLKS